MVEAAYDRVIDSSLRRDDRICPTRRVPFAIAVLKNLIRSGPERRGLDRRSTAPLAIEPADPEPSDSPSVPRNPRIPDTALGRLTPAERHALEALLAAPNMRAAAAAAHMSPRDLRTRFRRIVRKVRQDLHEQRARR